MAAKLPGYPGGFSRGCVESVDAAAAWQPSGGFLQALALALPPGSCADTYTFSVPQVRYVTWSVT